MTRYVDVPFMGGGYADENRPFSYQECINYIVDPAEAAGTRGPMKLRQLPGFETFATTEVGSGRGLHNVEGRLFAVSGNHLYQINANGTSTQLGYVPGVLRTKMAHNQVTGGNQLAIPTGSSGYVYDTSTGVFGQITDDAFPGAITFDFVDGYITTVDPFGRFAATSDIADAYSWNTLDQVEAEGQPDLIVGQIVTHREWWLMGARTIEPFTDTGANTGTFQRQDGMVMDRGLASPWAVALLDNTTYWLGENGSVYMANGYTPIRISTRPIEQEIANYDLSKAFAMAFEDRGHSVFYLTFPDGRTLGYDAATRLWHSRISYGLKRWRVSDLVRWNGGYYAQDYANGHIYRLDWNLNTEDGVEMPRERISGVLSNDSNRTIVNRVKFEFDTGVINQENATLDLRYSKDGGHNWSDWRQLDMGNTGDFVKDIIANRFGMGGQWCFHIRTTSDAQANLVAVAAMIEGVDS